MKRTLILVVAILAITSVPATAQVVPSSAVSEQAWLLRLPQGISTHVLWLESLYTTCGDFFVTFKNDFAKISEKSTMMYLLVPTNYDGEIRFLVRKLQVRRGDIAVVIDEGQREPIVELIGDIETPRMAWISLRRTDYNAAKDCLPKPVAVREGQ